MIKAIQLVLLACSLILSGCGKTDQQNKTADPSSPAREIANMADTLTPEIIPVSEEIQTPLNEMPAQKDTLPQKNLSQSLKMEGTFFEIQWGDYAHFVIQKADNEYASFWIASSMPEKEWAPFDSNTLKGRKVRVTYEKVKRFIPESGGEEEFDEMTAVKLLD